MTDIDVVSLDLDDTLWDMGPVIRRAERVLAAWLAERYPPVAAMFGPQHMVALRRTMLERYPQRRHDVSFLRRATLAHCFEVAGCPAPGAEAAFEVFLAERNRVELFDDVLPGLDALRAAGYTLVALTNGNADLKAIGIGHYFAAVVRAADVGASKPQAEIFQAVLDRVDPVPPQRVVHVGDDPRADVAGAQAAGMRAIWVNRTRQAWPEGAAAAPAAGAPYHRPAQVTNLAQLVELLDTTGGLPG